MTAKQPARQCFLLVAEALFSIFKNEWGFFFLSLKKQRRGWEKGVSHVLLLYVLYSQSQSLNHLWLIELSVLNMYI